MATTSYQIQGNPTNVLPHATPNGQITVFNQTTGQYTWVPNLNVFGVFLNEFIYEMLCDNVVVDQASENQTVLLPTANAEPDNVTTTVNTPIIINIATNDTLCSAGTTSFQIITQSPNGVATVTSAGVLTFTPSLNFVGTASGTYGIYCNGYLVDTASWTVLINSCIYTLNYTAVCFTSVDVTCTLHDVNEPNRVITWTSTQIVFNLAPGTHNYEISLLDHLGKTHTIILNNLTC